MPKEAPKKRGRKPGQIVFSRLGRRAGHGSIMESWTEDEVARLVDAVKRYRIDDFERIQKLVPTRTVRQVEEYIKICKTHVMVDRNRMRAVEKSNGVVPSREQEAPIESWLDLAQEIGNYEAEDFSKIMETVMSMIYHYEEFPEPSPEFDMDYRKIYQYLKSLLADGELPALNQLESAVMLHLMEELLRELRLLDLRLPRKLMLWKYGLLNTKVDPSNLTAAVSCSGQALFNDFSSIVPIPDPAKETMAPNKGKMSQGLGTEASSSSKQWFTATKKSVLKDPLRSVEVQLCGSRRHKKAARKANGRKQGARGATAMETEAPANTEQPSCSRPAMRGSGDGSSQGSLCEVFHWPNSSSDLHLVHNPLAHTMRAEPCSCPQPRRLLPEHRTTAMETEAPANTEQPSCSRPAMRGSGDGSSQGSLCEVFHWPNSSSDLHLVHNPLALTTRAEPCSCPQPRRLLPEREEDWPLFFLQSELEELQRLTGQSQPGQSQTGQSQSRLSQPRQSQPGQSQPGQSQPGQSQSRLSQPRQSQPAQSQPGQSLTRQPQPGQSLTRQSQPRQSQTSQSQPGQSRQGQPNKDQPDQEQSEQGQSGSEQIESGQSSSRQSESRQWNQSRCDKSGPEQSHPGQSGPGQSGFGQSRPTGPHPEQPAPDQADGSGAQGSSGVPTERMFDLGKKSEPRGKGPGRPPGKGVMKTMPKPPLLTLNPFCIPVDMIKLKKPAAVGYRRRDK